MGWKIRMVVGMFPRTCRFMAIAFASLAFSAGSGAADGPGTPARADPVGELAMADLEAAVRAASRTDREFPLERALESLAIAGESTTRFGNEDVEDGQDRRFPRMRPAGVSEDEWTALLASDVGAGGENGVAGYLLIDLDGDGDRDLVVESYVGGTGLFAEVFLLQRKGGRFLDSGEAGDEATAAPFYVLNGRGANEQGDWIRLRGRVYLAYRSSAYGEDHLSLLAPFTADGPVPGLVLRYRYALEVPREQAREGLPRYTLEPRRWKVLNRHLARVERMRMREGRRDGQPLCRRPRGVEEDAWWGDPPPGHYSQEIIANMAIELEGACHVAQLVGWFGRYAPEEGLFADLTVTDPRTGEQTGYAVNGRRELVGMVRGFAPASPGDVESPEVAFRHHGESARLGAR